MPDRSRIPRKINAFHAYIRNTSAYLNTSPETRMRLGIDEEEFSLWQDFLLRWNDIYPDYSDKAYRRTTAIKNTLRKVQKDFIAFASPLLTRMSAMKNVNVHDVAAFHFVIKRKKPSRHIIQLEGYPAIVVELLGTGWVRFICKAIQEARRNSIAWGADGVEFACYFGNEKNGKENEWVTFYSTIAKFIHKFPSELAGQRMLVRARWIKFNNQLRSGPFSNITTTVLR